jgi:hypothetical protein
VVKSTIASLRSLTLPFGATSGQRIELDGVNGEIRIYDVDGELLLTLEGEFGFQGYDTSENVRIRVSSPLGGAYSAIQMWTATPEETSQALISVADFVSTNRMVITPGQVSSKGNIELTSMSAAHDDTKPAMIQMVCISLDDPGNLRPIIYLTGAAAPSEATQLHTIVYDLFYGTPTTYGVPPTKLGFYPRGVLAFASINADSNTSSAGTLFGITGLSVSNVPLKDGHYYRITCQYHGMRTTVAGDDVQLYIRSGGVTLTGNGRNDIPSANTPMWGGSFAYIDGPISGDQTKSYSISCQRLAGTGSVGIGALDNPAFIMVEDLGGPL